MEFLFGCYSNLTRILLAFWWCSRLIFSGVSDEFLHPLVALDPDLDLFQTDQTILLIYSRSAARAYSLCAALRGSRLISANNEPRIVSNVDAV